MTATLIAVAMVANLMINLENDFSLLNEMRRAMKEATFNLCVFIKL